MLTPDDLIQPVGELSADLFPVLPGEGYTDAPAKLYALVGAWLLQAEAATPGAGIGPNESAQAAFVYWRGFSSACTRFASTPASVSVEGEGSVSYTSAQSATLCALADRYRLAYLSAVTPAPVAQRRRGSVVVRKAVAWGDAADGDEYGAAPRYPG